MKLLTGLVLAQFVLVCVLLMRVLNLEGQLLNETAEPPAEANRRPLAAPVAQPSYASSSIDEAALRRIVREEVRAGMGDGSFARSGAASADPPPDAQRELEQDFRREAVEQSLNYYSETGVINEIEMAELQREIARLRPEDRRAMLGRLVRALNEGVIDGRL